jgi:tRNA pseudouridine38-40 synthase
MCAVLRKLSSSSSNNNKNNNNGSDSHHPGVSSTSEEDKGTNPDANVASPGLKGWKRYDISRDGGAATAPTAGPTSAHDVVDKKRDEDDARRRAASARLAGMFVESGRHTQWMQEQHQTSSQSPRYEEGLSSMRCVVAQGQREAHDSAHDVDGHLCDPSMMAQTALAPKPDDSRSTIVRSYAYDEDEDGAAAAATGSTALAHPTPTDILEQELLDDNFLYYPSPASLHTGDAGLSTTQDPSPNSSREHYVPGQQIIAPGFTRYRVDVQYQGSDFDGWYKSVQRTRPPSAKSEAASSGALAEGGSRHYARTVLEEALAVALDVASVTVVAAVIPETGVSVRRLTCHVDVPSEVELQSRTILQRATLWLHRRHQPLAILSCYPCKNQDFHARHSGVRRVYCYRILNRIAPPLFDAGLQWHVDRYLDVARMQRMARKMEGTHDYGYFADPKMANALRRAAAHTGGGGGQVVSSAYSPEHEPLLSHGLPRGQAPAAPKVSIDRGLTQLERAAALPTFNEYGQRVITYQAKPREYFKAHTNLPTVRTIDKIDVVRQEDEVLIWFVGQSFLRHQIRNMVSVLKAGGHGLWDDQELQHALQSGFEVSRKKFARERLPPAPVHGLTLWDVEYPAQHMSDFVSYVDAGPYEPYDVSAQQ